MEFELARADESGGWDDVSQSVLELAAREDLKVGKAGLGDPMLHGFERSAGTPRGQIADYRRTLENCRCIHALEFGDYYLVHWDEVSPKCSVPEHLRRDAPGAYVATGAAVFAAAGAGLAGKGNRLAGATVGGLVGLVVAVLTLPEKP